MRYFLIIFLLLEIGYSSVIIQKSWRKAESFSKYLQKNHIPQSLLMHISQKELKSISKIRSGIKFYELRKNGKLLQALIPINKKMRIRLYKDSNKKKFYFEIVPASISNINNFKLKSNLKTKGKAKLSKSRKRDNVKLFRRPIDKMHITSTFSLRRWHPILHKYLPHYGIDIGAKTGTPIHATYDGKVVYVGWKRGYGRVVKIRHPHGYLSLYAHQSRIAVRVGQHVSRGQIIGYVGRSGRATGPHLHFGLYKNSKAVNPQRYIEKRSINR